MTTYVQRNQPPGVPPLELTGERTLPDVPEENYWYRRHLAVYRWIAERCAGRRVVDMACGEGYGSAVLAERARDGGGRGREPGGARARPAALRGPNLRFERALVEQFEDGAPWDAIVFLQTIEHVSDPGALLERFARLLAPGGDRLRQHAEPPHARAARRRALRQPLARARVHRRRVPGPARAALLATVELLGLFHARKLRAHELAIAARLGPAFTRRSA